MATFEPISSDLEQLTKKAVDAAFNVHSELGPGLLESVYEICMMHELTQAGLRVERQVPIPITYRGQQFDDALKLDLLIEKQLILELKAVEEILPVHKAQLITYLKLTNLRLGLLINFNVPIIKNGIKRVVYG
ncbi:MAG: GxxExxY protein [Aureliella sp.]